MQTEHAIEILRQAFIQRPDAFGFQKPIAGYRTGIKGTITDQLIKDHLKGKITLGVYTFNKQNKLKWICNDFDGKDLEKELEKAKKLYRKLKEQGYNPILEFSGKKGYHVWIFCTETDGKTAKAWATKTAKGCQVHEIFPKQEGTTKDKPFGNLVKMPLGKHQVSGKRSCFLDENFEPLGIFDGLKLLETTIAKRDVLARGWLESKAPTVKQFDNRWNNRNKKTGQMKGSESLPDSCRSIAKPLPEVVETIIAVGGEEGNRHERAFILIKEMHHAKFTKEEIEAQALAFNANCTPPKDKTIIKDHVKTLLANPDKYLKQKEAPPYVESNGVDAKRLEEKGEVPTLALVDFSKYDAIFKDTHNHLPAYNLINEELALIGNEYYAFKKYLNYAVESLRQPTINFPVGNEWFDNRIHEAVIAAGGMGKGQIKKIFKAYSSVGECSAPRTNLEQLIGKFVKTKGGGMVEKKGWFRDKKLIVDESQIMLCEEDRNLAGIMSEFRKAMDVYGFNEAEKNTVEANKLKYPPETRFGFLLHPTMLPALFFDLGTYRRLFVFELKPEQIQEDAATANLYRTSRTQEMKEYLATTGFECDTLIFSKEAIDEVVEFYKLWNRFLWLNPSQRIRAISKRMFFSGKLYFFRLIAILAIIKAEKNVSVETVRTACIDCIQFLLKTFENYANNTTPTLSRDTWKTAEPKEAMFFEWLHYNGATSKEATKVEIWKAQDKIQDIWGLTERPARSIFYRLKKHGLIDSIQGYQTSKTWLAFNPKLEGYVNFKGVEFPDLAEFILKKKKQGGYGGCLQGVSTNTITAKSNTSSSFSCYKEKKGRHPPATATMPTMKEGETIIPEEKSFIGGSE